MPETRNEQQRFFIFRLSGQLFGLPLAAVQEVAPFCALSRPATAPACLEGFLNLRGAAIPVLRLDRLLQLPESRPGLASQLLILETATEQWALIIDEALGIRAAETPEIMPVDPKSGCSPCITSEARVREGTSMVLAPDLLLLAREERVLNHLRTAERIRLAQLEGMIE